jgi:hypothetical protein
MILSLLIIVTGFLSTFYALCIICDDYLVPTVEIFILQFNIPEEVAAVTLVAFSSAAPELFLNSISAFTHTSDLSLSAILGSGMVSTRPLLQQQSYFIAVVYLPLISSRLPLVLSRRYVFLRLLPRISL